MMRRPAVSVFVCALSITVACGQKGPPLAPLHLVPAAPTAVSAARVGSEARLRFNIPATNQNGPGAIDLDRVEVFAATVAPGAVQPANRELLTAKYRVGTIAVKPPPVEGETPPPNAPPDTRPSAGDKATFVEKLTPEAVKPVFTTPAKPAAKAAAPAATAAAPAATEPQTPPSTPVPAAPPTTTPPTTPPSTTTPTTTPPAAPAPATTPPSTATLPSTVRALPAETAPAPAAPAAAAVTTPPVPTYASRVYTVRGVTRSGRPGQPSSRVELPLVDPPAPPASLTATPTETSINLSWKVVDTGEVKSASDVPLTFNIYKVGASDPINSSPVAATAYERAGVEFGTEECFVVRAVEKIGASEEESEVSEPACVTPRDTYPPKAPQHLSAVAAPGTINLSWDANTEADLAGYLVLRGEAPGDTLQPLTPAPITATNFEDKTAKPGVRYVYAIVAVDKAAPPNRSAPSARIEETAR